MTVLFQQRPQTKAQVTKIISTHQTAHQRLSGKFRLFRETSQVWFWGAHRHKVCYLLWRRWKSRSTKATNQTKCEWLAASTKFYDWAPALVQWFCRMTPVLSRNFDVTQQGVRLFTLYCTFCFCLFKYEFSFSCFLRSSVSWINLHSFCNVNRFAALLTSPSNSSISSALSLKQMPVCT